MGWEASLVRVARSDHQRALELLGDRDAVVAEGLSKVYHEARSQAFEPPTPLLTRALRGRRPQGLEEDVADEDDDDLGDDDDETYGAEGAGEEPETAVWALREASFRVRTGAAVALVGGSASGKTTLLHLLAGAESPTAGRAVLAGRPPPLINVAQHLMAQTLSPAANVAVAGKLVGLSKRRVRPHVERVLALAGISEADRRVGATRAPFAVAAAAAVELASQVLLLDDPFARASDEFRQRLIEAIERRRAEGATVLLETRDRETQRRICDEALWLEQGSIVRMGPIDEILAAYDASAAAAQISAPHPGAERGFNETAAIVAGTGESNAVGNVALGMLLELSRAAVTLQGGVGLVREDGLGLWYEQPEPIVCKLPGFHRLRLAAHDVPPGRYEGQLQVRVLEAGSESVIARRGAFEVTVGTPDGKPHRFAGEPRWEGREASWLYAPEEPPS